jgi:hypothetical protein
VAKKEVIKVEESTALVPAMAASGGMVLADPDAGGDWGEFKGAGLKDLPANEKSIPFLNLMQTNSPEVEQQTIPGIKAGDFLNSVTKEVIPGEVGLLIQPIHIERVMVLWRDRDKGGGIVARYEFTSPEVEEAIRHNNGTHISTKEAPLKIGEHFLVDTRYLYAHVLTERGDDTAGYFIFGANKSKIKPTQDFISSIDQVRGGPPLFAARARMTSVQAVQKGSGKLFKNVKFMPGVEGATYFQTLVPGRDPQDPSKPHPLLLKGAEFRKAILAGQAKADFSAESFEKEDEGATEKRHF